MAADPASDKPDVEPIQDGVFFTLPDALPRGRHNLPRDQVREAQRERSLAAMTELLAGRGYRGFSVDDIAGRAGISLHALYQCFDSKDACVFAGYDRFIEVLLRSMAELTGEVNDQSTLGSELVAAYFATLGRDLVVARAYQVEIDALGYEARERRRNALTLFAEYIKVRVRALDPELADELPDETYLGVVYAARQLASDALDQAPQPDFARLSGRLESWVADVFRRR